MQMANERFKGAGMNGTHEVKPLEGPARSHTMNEDTPIAYYTPVAITPGTIKAFLAAVVGIIGFLAVTPVAERYMMPAKDSDLQAVRVIVDTMRSELKESRDAVARLTLAVDNLSGIVNQMRTAQAGKPKTIR
jgi:hypothetical protein